MLDEAPQILSQTVNMPVLRMPGRRFPGVLLQGDTLSSLYGLANMICRLAHQQDNRELVALAQELRDEFAGILQEYESVMKSHGLVLPYSSRLEAPP